MMCWHCDSELEFNYQSTVDAFKLYHCETCDKWYEMRKDKERVNGAVPVRFFELESRPQIQASA
jgi:hypothetical protein